MGNLFNLFYQAIALTVVTAFSKTRKTVLPMNSRPLNTNKDCVFETRRSTHSYTEALVIYMIAILPIRVHFTLLYTKI